MLPKRAATLPKHAVQNFLSAWGNELNAATQPGGAVDSELFPETTLGPEQNAISCQPDTVKSIQELLEANFGVVARFQLLNAGYRSHDVDRGLRRGVLQRIRHGWFQAPGFMTPNPDVVTAVAAGGVLTGARALALRGAWDPGGPEIPVRAAYVHRIQQRDGVHRVALPQRKNAPIIQSVDSLQVAFQIMVLTSDRATCTVVGDSLVQRQLLSRDEMQDLVQDYPQSVRSRIARVDGRAESGAETLVRMWLEAENLRFVPQFVVEQLNARVDFLVEDDVVIEVDSRAHHTGELHYQRDRTRDQQLSALGYRVIRVTYEDVYFNWPAVSQTVLAALGQRHIVPA